MKTLIAESIVKLLEGVSVEEVADMLETPPEESMGDFALPCFAFAKVLRPLFSSKCAFDSALTALNSALSTSC